MSSQLVNVPSPNSVQNTCVFCIFQAKDSPTNCTGIGTVKPQVSCLQMCTAKVNQDVNKLHIAGFSILNREKSRVFLFGLTKLDELSPTVFIFIQLSDELRVFPEGLSTTGVGDASLASSRSNLWQSSSMRLQRRKNIPRVICKPGGLTCNKKVYGYIINSGSKCTCVRGMSNS